MTNLKIPNLNMNSDKYIFKKKLNLKRKSKKRLFLESFLMFILSLSIVYINYLIPNKSSLLQNMISSFSRCFSLIIDLFYSLYDIALVIFIFISLVLALILLLGSLYRISKITKRKPKKIVYK